MTVTEVTVIPELLNPTLVLPGEKFVPRTAMLIEEPRVPEVGETDVIVGTGIGAATAQDDFNVKCQVKRA